MSSTWYDGTDWEQSSGPIISRQYDASADLWPHGAGSEIGGGDKDTLADGDHPILAIGAEANKPNNLTGVVLSYNSDADLAILNMADKFISQQYVANIVSYGDVTYSATYVRRCTWTQAQHYRPALRFRFRRLTATGRGIRLPGI